MRLYRIAFVTAALTTGVIVAGTAAYMRIPPRPVPTPPPDGRADLEAALAADPPGFNPDEYEEDTEATAELAKHIKVEGGAAFRVLRKKGSREPGARVVDTAPPPRPGRAD